MNIRALITMLGLMCASHCVGEGDRDAVLQFSKNLKKYVATLDVGSFENIKCVPDANEDCAGWGEVVSRIFPEDGAGDFQEIMRNPNLDIQISGPLTVESAWPDMSYVVFFFDRYKSPFGEDGRVSTEVGKNELYRSFLQTIVTVKEGCVYFHRTPFYLIRHHPYAGDHG